MRKRNNKGEIFFPTFSVILMLLFGIPGLLAMHSVHKTVKDCTGEVTGFVDCERDGSRGEILDTVEGKYVEVGKDGRYWIEIVVNTDGIFPYKKLYADRAYGSEGDRITIYYNPENTDEYYIRDYKLLNGYGIAVVCLAISGIMLGLSVFLMIYYSVKKEDTEEENKKDEKKDEKKQKKTKRVKKGKKQDKHDVSELKISLGILFVGVALCLLSVLLTYSDIHIKRPIPFNNYSDDLDNTIYSVVIEEKPTEVCAYGEYSKYYDLKVGNEHILALGLDKNTIDGAGGSANLRGTLKRISANNKEQRTNVKAYYQRIGYYDTLKDEEFAYYYLSCTEISLWEELKSRHMVLCAFGITIIIIGFVFLKPIIDGSKH